jgi:hypothetical protein
MIDPAVVVLHPGLQVLVGPGDVGLRPLAHDLTGLPSQVGRLARTRVTRRLDHGGGEIRSTSWSMYVARLTLIETAPSE